MRTKQEERVKNILEKFNLKEEISDVFKLTGFKPDFETKEFIIECKETKDSSGSIVSIIGKKYILEKTFNFFKKWIIVIKSIKYSEKFIMKYCKNCIDYIIPEEILELILSDIINNKDRDYIWKKINTYLLLCKIDISNFDIISITKDFEQAYPNEIDNVIKILVNFDIANKLIKKLINVWKFKTISNNIEKNLFGSDNLKKTIINSNKDSKLKKKICNLYKELYFSDNDDITITNLIFWLKKRNIKVGRNNLLKIISKMIDEEIFIVKRAEKNKKLLYLNSNLKI